MRCRHARRLLTETAAPSSELRQHVADCAPCAAYQRRHETVLRALGDHRAVITPPAGFAARVRSRLQPAGDPIGWAALRLLPVSLVLVLLLSWLNLRLAGEESATLTDPTTAVLSWAIEADTARLEDGR